MKSLSSRLAALAGILAVVIHSTSALAQIAPPSNLASVSVREYFVANDQGRRLVTVHLLNGVNAPGVYHVPVDTDLAQLIAYAGGAPTTSDLTKITVRSHDQDKYHVARIDLESELKNPDGLYRLRDRDVVQINQVYTPERPMAWISIVSAIASIALSAYLISDLQKR